jgi:hypothetical protein
MPPEIEELLALLLQEGCWIVLDKRYQEPKMEVVRSRDALARTLRSANNHGFFILSEKSRRSDLVLREFVKDGKPMWYVPQRTGGPSLDLFYWAPRSMGSVFVLPPGMLAYHSAYIDSVTGKNIPAPVELRELYGVVLARMRRMCSRLKLGSRSYLLSRQASDFLSGGGRLGGPFLEIGVGAD